MSSYAPPPPSPNPVPSRDEGPQQGLQSFDAQQTQAPTSPEPDPQAILKQKLDTFRSIDQLIETMANQSQVGSKYAAQAKNLFKAWMMDEVKNTRERKPPENPKILGAS